MLDATTHVLELDTPRRRLDSAAGGVTLGLELHDSPAYHAMLRAVMPLLRQVARNRGVPPAELDDVVQETLLSLHRCRHAYDPARPFLPWLVGIAQHCARDRLRKRMREDRRVHAMRTLHEAWGETPGMDEVHSGGLLAESLATLIRALPPAQREAIEMVALAQLDLREAAQASGRSIGAVKVNLHRARETLHQRLAEADGMARATRNRQHSARERAEEGAAT